MNKVIKSSHFSPIKTYKIKEELLIEQELIDTATLAKMLSVSKKFIETHRNKIAGSMKVGGVWRFSLSEIKKRISTGRNIIEK